MSSAGSTFRTAEPDLTKVLDRIHTGELQLPDFQRSWVWDDIHIRSLIASISRSFPIGSVMLLETGGDGVRFRPRVVQGAPDHRVEPQQLILDGQQRMTSLYLALRSGAPVPTRTEKGRDIERLYYLDIEACLDPEADREDAVVSVPSDRVLRENFNRDVTLDLSTDELEAAAGFFPLASLLDAARYAQWRRGYQRMFRLDESKLDRFDAFEVQVLEPIRRYRVPAIELTRDTSKEAVCQVFEKVNTGGVSLTVFELATATFAADDFDLRKDWETRSERFNENEILRAVESTDFLQAVTLLASYERHLLAGGAVSCKRRDMLNLTLAQYQKCAARIEQGFVWGARLLARERVFDARNLPYRTQLVPLAGVCAVLGDRFDVDTTKQKLARWYWCGVFGELYGGSTETRLAYDIADVPAWISGGAEPRTIRDANFSPTRLLTLQSRQSAAYKGLAALLIQEGCADFINGDTIELTTYFDQAVDIHHIFPRSHCEKQHYPRNKWNSVVNKAPLTARTNRIIGGHAPSKYVGSIERNHDVSVGRMDAILASHLIDPALLRQDAFDAFIVRRARALLDVIEKATGKEVSGRDTENVVAAFGAPLVA